MKATVSPLRLLSLPNLRAFYIWTFVSKLSVLTPFFALFLAYRLGVGTTEIGLLFATYSATQFLSEVPLGALADRIGETPTLKLSSALALAGVACLVFGPLPALFVGQVLFALSESASSGVKEALLFRLSDDDEAQGVPYRKAQAAFTSAAWCGVISAGVLGTVVAVLSLEALGFVAFAIAGCALTLALWLPSAPGHTGREDRTEAFRIRRLSSAFAEGGSFRFWLIAGAATNSLLIVTYFTIQPLLNELDIAGAGNGLLYSAVTVFAAYGSHLTNRINSRFRNWYAALAIALGLVIVSILVLRISGSLPAVFCAFALLRFGWGWIGTTTTIALNEAVKIDGLRATILSMQSLVTGLLNAAALAVFAGLGLTAATILLVLAGFAVCGAALTVAVLAFP